MKIAATSNIAQGQLSYRAKLAVIAIAANGGMQKSGSGYKAGRVRVHHAIVFALEKHGLLRSVTDSWWELTEGGRALARALPTFTDEEKTPVTVYIVISRTHPNLTDVFLDYQEAERHILGWEPMLTSIGGRFYRKLGEPEFAEIVTRNLPLPTEIASILNSRKE